MKRLILANILCFFGALVFGQQCPNPVLISPSPGSNNVSVNATITWNEVVGVPGYIISIGTSPGGVDIVNEVNVGSALSYTPPLGLPEDTQIYVTITLFFFEGGIPDVVCNSETFRTEDVIAPPGCTNLQFPQNGATNINVATNISWNYAPTATSYTLSIGTSPGGTEILAPINVGNVLSYNPPVDLPPNSDIYVTVIPENGNLPNPVCTEQVFSTGDIAALPGCTSLISPANGEINVPLTPNIEWNPVAGADGYRVTIGLTPFTAEVLNEGVFTSTSTFVIDFEPNRTFFITIVPFNSAGDAIGCTQETFSTVLGCGPFFEASTGELVTLFPEIDFPETLSFCQNEAPLVVTATDEADGYRWYRVDQFGDESLISSDAEVSIFENGQYRYEAYNIASQAGSGTLECPNSQLFSVVSSEAPRIDNIDIVGQPSTIRITVEVSGAGDYEYALDNIDGPYQDSNVFDNVIPGTRTVYVRDKNGCGIAEETITQDLTLEGFPKFFTPNGDGINDFWQFIPPPSFLENPLVVIHIFDRYGKLLVQLDPLSRGWDGNFNGTPLPASDYWFKARDMNSQELSGHFTLKR